jgi:hypothetical protein
MNKKLLTIMRLLGLLLVAGIVLSTPCLQAQDWSTKGCGLTGTWYGGGEVTRYLLTLVPRAGFGESYTLIFNGAFSSTAIGYPVATAFTGTVTRRYWQGDNPYAITFGGMMNKSSGFPAPTPDVWALHATAKLTDCDTLVINYDFFGGYLWPTDKVPLVSPPDYVPVPTPFSETYKRLPTTCSQCKTP